MDARAREEPGADRYRLKRIIGRGAWCETWLAEDLLCDRRVAIKQLRPEHRGDAEARARFDREVGVVMRMAERSEAVVRVFDVVRRGAADQQLVMAYLAGGTAAAHISRLREQGPSAVTRACCELVRRVAAALDAGADIHVVHRDVKPSNVIVDDSGFAWLIDYGVAHLRERSDLTEVGRVTGTWLYMAPEVQGGQEATGRSDQYSLAVTALELLSGRSVQDLADGRGSDGRWPNLQDHVGLPPLVDEVLAHALARDPEARFPTCRAFAEALEVACDGGQPLLRTAATTVVPIPNSTRVHTRVPQRRPAEPKRSPIRDAGRAVVVLAGLFDRRWLTAARRTVRSIAQLALLVGTALLALRTQPVAADFWGRVLWQVLGGRPLAFARGEQFGDMVRDGWCLGGLAAAGVHVLKRRTVSLVVAASSVYGSVLGSAAAVAWWSYRRGDAAAWIGGGALHTVPDSRWVVAGAVWATTVAAAVALRWLVEWGNQSGFPLPAVRTDRPLRGLAALALLASAASIVLLAMYLSLGVDRP